MKNIIEAIKANKGAIIKRGLIVVGTVIGLCVVGKVLMTRKSVEVLPGEEPEETDAEEDSEEE